MKKQENTTTNTNKKQEAATMKKQNNNKKQAVKPTYNDNIATVIVPAIVNEKEGFSVRFTEKQGKNIAIPTKCTNKNAFLFDVQHHVLKMVQDKAENKVTTLSAKKQEAEKDENKVFSEKDALTLKQNIALANLCTCQLKKYTLKKVDGKLVTNLPAKMAAAILTNTVLTVDCKSVAVYIKAAYNSTMQALESLYAGDTVILSKEEQNNITEVKNAIKNAFDVYFVAVADRCNEFNLTVSNKDVAKIVFAVYGGFSRDDKTGYISDSLKLDNKDEKKLAAILTNYVYGRMSGSKF